MTVQIGKDLLLKLKPPGRQNYQTVAGLRSKSISFNARPIDASNSDSAGRWRELLGESGLRTVDIAGQGIFKDVASDEMIRASFFAGRHENWEIVLPHFGVLAGAFALTALNYTGTHDGELRWDMGLSSAGEVSFATI